MSQFSVYFIYGYKHIVDFNGYDHILFIVALCAVYLLRDWKRVLILVTAFTVGHSVTLALTSLAIIHVNSSLVEFLIPLTIFVTAVSNIFKRDRDLKNRAIQLNYIYAVFFGLIHGMAFASALTTVSSRIAIPLVAFNLGLELAQIIIVIIFLSISFIFVDILKTPNKIWKIVISTTIAGVALFLMKDRIFW